MRIGGRLLVGLLGVGLLALTAEAAEVTVPQLIGNYNADGRGTYYFRPDTGSPGCGCHHPRAAAPGG